MNNYNLNYYQKNVLLLLIIEKKSSIESSIKHYNSIIEEMNANTTYPKEERIRIIASNIAAIIKNKAELEILESIKKAITTPVN